MAAGILLHSLRRVDDQQGRLGAGRAGDHVLQELDVAGSIQDEVGPPGCLEEDPRGIDGDPLGLFVLQGVEEEGVLERLRAALAGRPNLLQLALGQRMGVGQQPADDRALAVVDVADDDDVHPLGAGRAGAGGFLCGGG